MLEHYQKYCADFKANNLLFDSENVRLTLSTFHPDSKFEIRIIYNDPKGENKNIKAGGVFDDIPTAIKELERNSELLKKANCFFTINPVTLPVTNRIARISKGTTDADIECVRWLFIDLDTVRVPGTSATDEQLEEAAEAMRYIYESLKKLGFAAPLTAISGNGCHMHYRIDLPSNNENKELIRSILKELKDKYSKFNGKVDIDTAVYNPGRLCKLYGTIAHKGEVHRPSYLIEPVYNINGNINAVDLLQDLVPDKERVNSSNNAESTVTQGKIRLNPNDTLESFIMRHKLNVVSVSQTNYQATTYKLDHCPFNPEHKDASLFRNWNPLSRSYNGRICFHCYHNSCKDKTWGDVKDLFEPTPPKTPLTVETFTNYCDRHEYYFEWDDIKQLLNIVGFGNIDTALLQRVVSKKLYDKFKNAKYTDVTKDNIQECIIATAIDSHYNYIAQYMSAIEATETNELTKLCNLMKLNEEDKYLFTQWLKQCYAMLYNNSFSAYSLEFALVPDNTDFEDVIQRLVVFPDYLNKCIAYTKNSVSSNKLLVTAWICKVDKILSDKNYLTNVCALPYSDFIYPFDRNKDVVNYPHYTSYYTYDKSMLSVSDFWRSLHIPNNADLQAVKDIDIDAVWADIKNLIQIDNNIGIDLSNCFRLHQDKTPINDNTVILRRVIDKILNNCPNDCVVDYKYMTITDFKELHNELADIDVRTLGKQLKSLGYESKQRNIINDNGKSSKERLCYLPYWTNK